MGKVNVYYKTSDGKKFYTEDAAKNHAKTLKNKDVAKVVASNKDKAKQEAEAKAKQEAEAKAKQETAATSSKSKSK